VNDSPDNSSTSEALPFVSIIIPAKNEEANIERVLHALRAQNYPQEHYEIIVVDNLSDDATAELAAQYNDVSVLTTAGSIAAVRNKGITKAKGSILAFIDADCIAPPEWITQSIEHIQKDAKIGIVSSVLRLEDEQKAPWVERYWIENHRNKFPHELVCVPTISSYCFCIRKEAMEESGAFNPELATCEDADLGYRVTGMGWKIVADRSIEVIHLGNAKSLIKFFMRQLWQGGSNFQNALSRKFDLAEFGSLSAPVAFCTLLIGALLLAIFQKWAYAAIFLVVALSAPILISLKKSPVKNPKDLLAYFVIWSTYLSARGLGIFVKIKRTQR